MPNMSDTAGVPSDSSTPREKTSILVIDHDSAALEATARALRNAGFQVLTGSNAAEAIELAHRHCPALLLLAAVLPDADGVTVTRQLKRDPTLESTFIILLSNIQTGPTGQAKDLEEELTDGYITKPFSEPELLTQIGAFLRLRDTQEALRRSEAQLKKSQEIAHLGSWELDLATDHLIWSDEAYRIFGFRPQEFAATYEAFLDVVHPEDRAAVDAAYKNTLQEGKDGYEIEHRVIRKATGEIRYVHEKCEHVKDASGKIIRSIGMVQDITKRQQAERALEESEAEYRQVFERSPIGIFRFDNEGTLTNCNDLFVSIIGSSREALIGLDLLRLPDKRIVSAVQEALAGRSATFEGDYHSTTADKITPVRALFTALVTETGKVYGGIGIIQDTTAYRETQSLLQARLRLIEFAITHPLDQVLQKTLDEVCALSNSPIGFYHFLDADQKTLTLQAWSTRTLQEFCEAKGKGLHYSVDEAGVWVDCVRERRPVIHNDYASLPNRKGMPEGHAPLTRELVVPIMRRDRIVAILGIGNKPVDYTERDVQIVTYFADVAWEIAERKQVEEALRRKTEEIERFFTTALDLLCIADTDGYFRRLNPEWEKVLGYTQEELENHRFLDFVHPDDLDATLQAMSRLSAQQSILNFTNRYRHQDGTYRWIEWRSIPAGKLVYAAARDITARKLTEEALRESEERYRLLAENTVDVIWTTDAAVRFTYVSPSVEKLRGYTPQEVLQQSAEEVLTPDSLKKMQAAVMQTMDKIARGAPTEPGIHELEQPCKDGSTVWTEALVKPLLDEHGKLAGFLGVTRDITARREAENALRESEDRYRTLFETMAKGVIYQDANGKITLANPAAERIMGLTIDQMRGHTLVSPIWQIIREDGSNFPGDMHPAMVALRTGVEVPDTVMGVRNPQRNEYRWIIVRAVPQLRPGEDRPYQVYTTFEDITKRKQAEEALRESEDKYRTLFETMAQGVIYQDAAGEIISANPAAERILGRTLDEILGRVAVSHEWQNIHEDGSDFPLEALPAAVALRTGVEVPGTVVGVFNPQDDTFRWILVHAIPQFRPGEDKPYQVYATFEDITERKRAEEALRESEDKYRTLFETMAQGVIYQDADGEIISSNPAAERILGLTLDQMRGRTSMDPAWRAIHEDGSDFPGEMHPAMVALRTGAEVQSTVIGVFNPRSNEYRWITVHAVPQFHPGKDKPYQVYATFEDITERKQAVEELQESHRQLEMTLEQLRETQSQLVRQERMAAVGQLAAGIAHDFNNILAGIVLYTQISQRLPGLPPQLYERLKSIEEQAHHGANLVQQILDFGRQALLERQTLALAPFLEEMGELLRRTLPETIHLVLTCDADDAAIRADPTRVQQALVNLALNARDAMPQGGELHIALSRIPAGTLINCVLCGLIANGEWVEITVTDTGTGIPPDVLPHIFEPFFTTRAPLGHGLGLPQVYGIVSQHEGHIAVETQMGVGTIFRLYWPALPPLETPDKESSSAIAQGNGETILIAVDDKTVRTALVDVLTMLGYSAIEASDGQQALTLLQEQGDKIALVLSDWTMPGLAGLTFTQEMQTRHLEMPVVMLTGRPLSQETQKAMLPSVVGWVQKPITLEALSTAVARALQQQS